MRLAVLLVLTVTASGCLSATATASERRKRGVACVAAGAAVTVLGGYLMADAMDSNEGLDGLEQGLAGNALLAAGLGTMGFGAVSIFSAFVMDLKPREVAPVEQQVVTPPPPEADRTACVTWQANRDQERDPTRRAALDAAGPAHCRVPASDAR